MAQIDKEMNNMIGFDAMDKWDWEYHNFYIDIRLLIK